MLFASLVKWANWQNKLRQESHSLHKSVRRWSATVWVRKARLDSFLKVFLYSIAWNAVVAVAMKATARGFPKCKVQLGTALGRVLEERWNNFNEMQFFTTYLFRFQFISLCIFSHFYHSYFWTFMSWKRFLKEMFPTKSRPMYCRYELNTPLICKWAQK